TGEFTRIGFIPWGLKVYSEAFGGGLYDWDRGKVTINTPQNLRALEYIVARRKKLGYENVVRFEAGLTGADGAGGWRFLTGSYAMTLDGPWRVEQVGKFAPNFDYRTHILPPPKVGGRVGAGVANGNYMLIPSAAKHVDGAMDFVRFWSGLRNPERAAHFYVKGGWLPLTPAIANAPDYQAYLRKYPQFRTFVDLMSSPNLRVNPPVAYQQFLLDTVSRAEEAATRGRMSPAQALKNAEAELARELKRRKELGYQD
ncbi:extracellular solute-binding protein, partial [bacterium]